MTSTPKGAPSEAVKTPAKWSHTATWGACAALTALVYWARPLLHEAVDGSKFLPSKSVLALVLGVLVGALPGVRARLGAGAKRTSKEAIPVAIVLIGFSLELGKFFEGGSIVASIFVVLVAMLTAFAASLGFGRLFGLDPRASLLLGAGTAVCGNSAIMAVAPTVGPKDDDLALSIGVINLLGIVMVFALPGVAGLFDIEGARGGILAGLTVHAVPQAIATGTAFGADGAEPATLYKLMRVAMLAPVVLILAAALRRVRGEGSDEAKATGIPLFLVLFVVAAIVRATGIVDRPLTLGDTTQALWQWAKLVGKFLLGIALAAIGLGLNLRTLIQVGPRVLIVGFLAVTAMVAVTAPLVSWLL